MGDAQSFTPLLAALATGAALSHRLGWPDEPIGLLISEWRNDPRGAITIRNLLQSASGLAGPAAVAGSDLVAAHGGVGDGLALVGHVAQHVAVLVLRPGLAEM